MCYNMQVISLHKDRSLLLWTAQLWTECDILTLTQNTFKPQYRQTETQKMLYRNKQYFTKWIKLRESFALDCYFSYIISLSLSLRFFSFVSDLENMDYYHVILENIFLFIIHYMRWLISKSLLISSKNNYDPYSK